MRRRRTAVSIGTAAAEPDTGGMVGWALIEALVRAMPVEVALVGRHGAGAPVVVDQHVVGAFPADAADEPFDVTVRPRRAGGICTTCAPSAASTRRTSR
jgi:hypothetical protein